MSGKARREATSTRTSVPRVRRTALASAVALALGAPVHAAENTDIERLEQRLELLMQEIERLKSEQAEEIEKLKAEQAEQQQAIEEQQQKVEAQAKTVEEVASAAPAQAVVGGDYPGSFKLPGTDTSIKLGGYVKADLIYDLDADTGDSFAASAIPAEGTPAKEESFRAHARQTRINLSTWTPTPVGEVKTFIEGDFFGSGGNEQFTNGTGFRLRHAFGEVRAQEWDVLFGQTWTLFMPLASYPDTVDFFGPAGIPFIRQGQARVTWKGIENVTVGFSAENSELSARADPVLDPTGVGFVDSEGSGLNFGIDTIPDFVGAVEYNNNGWNLKASGVIRLLETDTAGGAPQSDDEVAWGGFVGGVVPLGALAPSLGDDTLSFNFSYGDGIGRYIINGFAQDAFIDATGRLETIESWGVAGALTHHWSNTFYSNVVYGRQEFDDTFAATDTDALQTVHVNLFWQPADNARFGVEWIYGERQFENSDLDNDAQRVQFGAQYFF